VAIFAMVEVIEVPHIETRMIIISPSSGMTPDQLMTFASSFSEDVFLKETCYGLLLQGEDDMVRRVVRKIRKISPYALFSKQRGYPIEEKRKCRRGREGAISGGPRPGFHQLDAECMLLEAVGKALESLDSNELGKETTGNERMDEDTIRRLVNDILLKI
jgi:putative methanogenesis marker protein 6